eukprot:m.48688 g.48688  ORF g.48688 m.48688 type:complete len:55 (+) comp33911_c0_seq4:3258-3422(+)
MTKKRIFLRAPTKVQLIECSTVLLCLFMPFMSKGGYPSTAESLQSLSQGSGTVH